MQNYFNDGFFAGMNMLIAIMQNLATYIGVPLASLAGIKIFNELKNNPSSNMLIAAGRFIKPTILFFLIFTFGQWTDVVGNAVYSLSGFLNDEYQNQMANDKRFTGTDGKPIDPWLYYQDVMIKARERENTKIASIMQEWQNLPDNQKTDEVNKAYMDKLQKEADNDPSWVGEKITSWVTSAVDWLIEGAYFIILLVIQKLQQGLLAFLMATGVLSLLISLAPNREGSFDVWITYFISIQLWSVALTILKIYYNASIIAEISKLEGMLNNGSSTLDYMDVCVEYMANCITYLLLFCSVPVLVGMFMSKTAGGELFSKLIGIASAGTMAATSYGSKAGKAAGGAAAQAGSLAGQYGGKAIDSMLNMARKGSLTNLSQ